MPRFSHSHRRHGPSPFTLEVRSRPNSALDKVVLFWDKDRYTKENYNSHKIHVSPMITEQDVDTVMNEVNSMENLRLTGFTKKFACCFIILFCTMFLGVLVGVLISSLVDESIGGIIAVALFLVGFYGICIIVGVGICKESSYRKKRKEEVKQVM